jgi:hypothetical protein
MNNDKCLCFTYVIINAINVNSVINSKIDVIIKEHVIECRMEYINVSKGGRGVIVNRRMCFWM